VSKKILITGATDGIGLATAKTLAELGHHLLIHGRSEVKLENAKEAILSQVGSSNKTVVECYQADLSDLHQMTNLVNEVLAQHEKLDVLINNAGVFKTPEAITLEGLDIRFVVNTIAPYLLSKKLIPLLKKAKGRIVNLSSAAQSTVELDALVGTKKIGDDFSAYAQSKLAITMWSRHMAMEQKEVSIVAVNPGSMLGSKMVQEGFGVSGKDISIGSNILVELALSEESNQLNGRYFDNDLGKFATARADVLDVNKTELLVKSIEVLISEKLGSINN